jgi:hypothetical protein
MKISRRDFLGDATASVGGLCFFGAGGWNAGSLCDDRGPEQASCAILDPGSECALRESLHGYQTALGGLAVCVAKEANQWLTRCRMIIVPGVGALTSASALLLLHFLDAGARVLLESEAGFSGVAEFATQQKVLHRSFGITVETPVDLWSRGKSIPYVSYEWPHQVMVRDFSRAVPVSGPSDEVIARVGTIPVALKKRVARGTLIFLGSPLGPSLRAGDREAHILLRLIAASA